VARSSGCGFRRSPAGKLGVTGHNKNAGCVELAGVTQANPGRDPLRKANIFFVPDFSGLDARPNVRLFFALRQIFAILTAFSAL
jgi:hypothetical protein